MIAATSREEPLSALPPRARQRRQLIRTMLRDATAPRTIAAMAADLDVHPNTVRFHINALVATQEVERVAGDAAGPGRPAARYRATRTMQRSGPSNYRLLASMLADHLATSSGRPAETATALGRRWGGSLVATPARGAARGRAQAVTALVAMLSELGFQPEPPAGVRSKEIRLRHCPFLELVDEHADVICPLHLGLLQGALTALDAPVTAVSLQPFVEPDLCVAQLARVGASAR